MDPAAKRAIRQTRTPLLHQSPHRELRAFQSRPSPTNAPGATRTRDLRFRFSSDSSLGRTISSPAPFHGGRAPGASRLKRARVYCRGGSPAGLYTFRRLEDLPQPRRRLGSGLPSAGSPEFTRCAPSRSRAGSRFRRKPMLYPTELPEPHTPSVCRPTEHTWPTSLLPRPSTSPRPAVHPLLIARRPTNTLSYLIPSLAVALVSNCTLAVFT
jgi:hypothetical protein